MPHASFAGLRVLSLESRRAREVDKLIRTYNGDPLVVPAMREVPLSDNTACLQFGEDLLQDRFDAALFFTGVGVRGMMRILETRYPAEAIAEKLRGLTVISRGVKPQAVLNELRVPITAMASEPATWREVIQTIDSTLGERAADMHLAVQEYGASNPELLAELVTRFDRVTKVPVYQWSLPDDLQPLREAVGELLRGTIDVVLFMTAVQVIHLFQIADDMGVADELRRALAATVIVSVGPTTTEELQHYRVQPDFEPSRPKMGFLINEAAQYAGKVLAQKRAALPSGDYSTGEQLAPSAVSAAVAKPHSGVPQVAVATSTMAGFNDGLAPLDILHEFGSRMATDPLHLVLERLLTFINTVIPCDSCFIYTMEADRLLLRASKNPHSAELDTLNVRVGEGIAGWVAQNRETVAIAERAWEDKRFSFFPALPEDQFEALLCTPILCANRVVGVVTVQHRAPYQHSDLQRRMLATLSILVGAEIERARLETENLALTNRLESRKLVDRAKGLLQQELGITEEEAYRKMQTESRQRRRSMKEIAEAVLLSSEMRKRV